MRNSKLSKYSHHVNNAWEIATVPDDHTRSVTVMYESTVELVFKEDPEKTVIRVPQFTVLELRHCDVDGALKLRESRVYTDRSSVRG